MPRLEIEIASQQAAADAERIRAALDRVGGQAVTTQGQIDRMATSATRDMAQAERGAIQLAAANGRLTATFAANRTVIQQAGFQIADFATQVAAGTSAATAFAQQGSQILGVLGPMGAVAGAALAVLVPLGAAFLSAGDDAESLSDSMDNLTAAVRQWERAAADASAAASLMATDVDAVSGSVLALLNRQEQLAKSTALTALRSNLEGISSAVSGLTFDLRLGNSLEDQAMAAEQLAANVEILKDEFGLAANEALAFLEAAKQFQEAQSLEEQTRAARELASVMELVGINLEELPPAAQELLTQLQNAEKAAADLGIAVDPLASQFFAAATAAASISPALQDAINKANEFKQALPATLTPFTGFDPVASMIGSSSPFPLSPDETGENLPFPISPNDKPVTRSPSGTRRPTTRDTGRANDGLAILDFGEARSGLFDFEKEALESTERINDAFADLGDSAADVIGGLIDGTMEWDEAIGQLITSFGKLLIEMQKTGDLDSFGGFLSALSGQIFGTAGTTFTGGTGITAGFGFAAGGYTGNGSPSAPAGIVHGQEYVFDAAAVRRIGVGRLEQIRSGAASGGGGPLTVNVAMTLDARGHSEAAAVLAATSRMMDDFVRNRLPEEIQAARSQGRF